MIPNDIEIVEQARKLNYSTPFFYTSRDILEHNYKTFKKLFDNGEIYYALKANSEQQILTCLNKLGSGFEAASYYEIELLLSAGVDPTRIIYGTSVKPLTQIKQAAAIGVTQFAADSKEEIEKIAVCAPGSKVFIRMVVDDKGSVFTMSERFGAPGSKISEYLLYAKSLDLIPQGVSFYVGSQATRPELWAKGVQATQPIMDELLRHGIKLEMLDIGGGFPTTYNNHLDTPLLEEIVTRTHNALHTLPYMPRVFMEPGRGIVASSTILVTEVISKTIRHDKVWLCLDGGIYNALYEAMIHQGATQYIVHPPYTPKEDANLVECVLAGPTGDSLDIISRGVFLPEDVTVGSRLYFENAGAYTISMASSFNGFPTPKLYLG